MAVASRPAVVSEDEGLGAPEEEAAPETATAPTTTAGAARRDVILDIRELKTYFYTYDGVVKALDGVTFKVRRGETLGLVGETGCGKSVTAFSVTKLIPDPPGRIMDGRIYFRGANLLWDLRSEAKFKPVPKTNRVKVSRRFRKIRLSQERMAAVRGGGVSMIFQEPTSALNPIFTVADQISEALLLHRGDQVVDTIRKSEPDAVGVEPALQRLAEAARSGEGPAIRAAAERLGEAAELPSIGTQAFYMFRGLGGIDPDERIPEVRRAFRRVRLTRLQRSYLNHQKRLFAVSRELKEVYMREMRNGKSEPFRRRSLQTQRFALQVRGLPFRLWGIRRHVNAPLKQETFWETVKLLEGVSIANPVQVARGYPHELSGGMLQRVMISMALSAEPEVLIADEPTTALDVTIQAQILELMKNLKVRVGTAIVLITHDLAVIAEVADRVCVMYAGQIVETSPVDELFRRPLHPYSQGLIASIPRLDQPDKRLESIPGSVPNLIFPPEGCRFHPRCPYAMPICKEVRPPTTQEGPGHTVACYLYKGPVAEG